MDLSPWVPLNGRLLCVTVLLPSPCSPARVFILNGAHSSPGEGVVSMSIFVFFGQVSVASSCKVGSRSLCVASFYPSMASDLG